MTKDNEYNAKNCEKIIGVKGDNLPVELKIMDLKYILWGELILAEHCAWNNMFEDALKQIDSAESILRMILNVEGDKNDGGDMEQSGPSAAAN
jgi:hypothetical protein